MRLIDADRLNDEFEDTIGSPIARTRLKLQVQNQPTVDAVEVVRCKDCIHNQYGFCEKVNHNTGYESTCADVLRAEKRKTDG